MAICSKIVEKERNKAGWKSCNKLKAVARNRVFGRKTWRPYAPTGATRIDDMAHGTWYMHMALIGYIKLPGGGPVAQVSPVYPEGQLHENPPAV